MRVKYHEFSSNIVSLGCINTGGGQCIFYKTHTRAMTRVPTHKRYNEEAITMFVCQVSYFSVPDLATY